LSRCALLPKLIGAGGEQRRDGEKEGELGGGLARQAEQQPADDGGAGAGGAGDQGEGLGEAELEGVRQPMSSTRVDPDYVLAALGPQDDEGAGDEGQRHRDRLEQVRLDDLAEGEAEHRQRQEGDGEVGDEAARRRIAAQAGGYRAEPGPNSQQTARMAPVWMTISKSLPRSSLKPSRSPARIRWPVDGDGQEFGQPLDDAEDEGMQQVGPVHSAAMVAWACCSEARQA
jgi:hypothetical protein